MPAAQVYGVPGNGAINITASNVMFSGTVNAGTGTVTLQPDSAEAVTVAGGAGPFIVSTGALAAITAGTLQIDPTKTSTGMTVSGA